MVDGTNRQALAVKLRQSGLLWQDVDGEVVVLDLESSRYLRLNESGGVLWHELIEERDHDELIAALVAAFDVSSQEARTGVDAFIDSLDEFGFLR